MAFVADGTTLWLFTSLSSGSSQIVTATSRLETILKANRIEFKAVDVATDDKARSLWGRRAGKRKLPGLVRDGLVLGDINEVEEWNEYGEIKEMLALEGEEPAAAPAPPAPAKASATKPAEIVTASSKESKVEEADKTKSPGASAMSPLAASLQQLGFEAAQKAKDLKTKVKPSSATEDKDKAKPAAAETEKEEKAHMEDKPVVPETSTIEETKDATKEDNSAVSEPTTAEEKKDLPKEGATAGSEATTSIAAGDAPPVQASLKAAETTSETKTDTVRESETAAESTTLLSVESKDGLSADDQAPKQHRGSNLSAASAEEIAEVEEELKIEERPAEETAAAEEEPSLTSPKRQVSLGAEKQDLIQEEEGGGDVDDSKTDASAEERQDGVSHVKFIGEAPGQELDRVKANLGGKGVAENKKSEDAATLAAVEKPTSESEQDDKAKDVKGTEITAGTGDSGETTKDVTSAEPLSAPLSKADEDAAPDPGEILPGAKPPAPVEAGL